MSLNQSSDESEDRNDCNESEANVSSVEAMLCPEFHELAINCIN